VLHLSITETFLAHAADVLASKISGNRIASITARHAVESSTTLPHPTYPSGALSKKSILLANLDALSGPRQYRALCDLIDEAGLSPGDTSDLNTLRAHLVAGYGHLDPAPNLLRFHRSSSPKRSTG
jgi:hypothetical protein